MARWTARQVLRTLPRERRLAVIRAFWDDRRLGRQEKASVMRPWLEARGMRAAFLDKLPRSRRAELMADTALPEETAQQVLMSYHLVEKRDLLQRFLDLLGIEHEDGLIESEFDPPDEKAVGGAIEALEKEFDPEDVALYLRTLVASDPLTWAAVADRIGGPET